MIHIAHQLGSEVPSEKKLEDVAAKEIVHQWSDDWSVEVSTDEAKRDILDAQRKISEALKSITQLPTKTVLPLGVSQKSGDTNASSDKRRDTNASGNKRRRKSTLHHLFFGLGLDGTAIMTHHDPPGDGGGGGGGGGIGVDSEGVADKSERGDGGWGDRGEEDRGLGPSSGVRGATTNDREILDGSKDGNMPDSGGPPSGSGGGHEDLGLGRPYSIGELRETVRYLQPQGSAEYESC